MTVSVGENFENLLTDLRCWLPIFYIEKVTNMTTTVTNIAVAVWNGGEKGVNLA